MKTRFFRVKLSYKLIAVVLLGGLLPIALLSGIVIFYVQQELEAHLGRQLGIQVEDLRNEIDLEILGYHQELRELAASFSTGKSLQKSVTSFLADENRTRNNSIYNRYRCIGILSLESDWITRQGTSCADLTRLDLQESDISRIHWIDRSIPTIHLKLRVQGNRYSGSTLVASIDLRPLSEMLARTRISGGIFTDIVVFTDERVILARRDISKDLRTDVLSEYPFLSDWYNYNSDYLTGSQAVAAVMKPVGLVSDLEPLFRWNIALIQPLNDLSEKTVLLTQRLRFGLLIAGFLTFVTCLGLSLLLLKRILKPIQSLIHATKRVQEGDLATPILVSGSDELAELGTVFNEMMAQLRESLTRLRNLATKDELTGVYNRRVFNERLRIEIARVKRYEMTLSLAMMDIDRFKTINDRFGHAFGDKVLREISKLCQASCRSTDVFARYGGEEFAMIVPQTDKEQCIELMERIRSAVDSLQIAFDSSVSVSITISIGVASIPEDAASREELFFLADQALYSAKRAGRNKVVGAAARKIKPA